MQYLERNRKKEYSWIFVSTFVSLDEAYSSMKIENIISKY